MRAFATNHERTKTALVQGMRFNPLARPNQVLRESVRRWSGKKQWSGS